MDNLASLAFPIPTPEPARFEVSADVRRALSALALAVNHGLEDEQLKVTAYALREVPASLVRRACLRLAETSKFWPRPVELRECADEIARDDAQQAAAAKLLPLPASEDNEPRFFCLDCRDEPFGWRVFKCGGKGKAAGIARGDGTVYACSRRKDHAAHSYVETCACAQTNPVSAAHRRRMDEARVKAERRR